MGPRKIRYRPWEGTRRSPHRSVWVIAMTGLRLLTRRKLFYIFLLLGSINYLVHAALVYFRTEFTKIVRNMENPPPFLVSLTSNIQEMIFSGTGDSYKDFIFLQSIPVMLLLAYAGIVWLTSDYKLNALPFYLSRPPGRWHFFLGKIAPLWLLASLLTWVPALALFLQYGAFTTSLDYWIDNDRIFFAILASGLLIATTTSVLLMGIAASFRRPAGLLLVWGAVFVFLPGVSQMLRSHFERRWSYEEAWGFGLLNVWKNLEWACKGFFQIQPERYTERMLWSCGILAVLGLLSLLAFARGLSRTEVVD